MGRMQVGYRYTLQVFRTASLCTVYVLGRIAKLPNIYSYKVVLNMVAFKRVFDHEDVTYCTQAQF